MRKTPSLLFAASLADCAQADTASAAAQERLLWGGFYIRANVFTSVRPNDAAKAYVARVGADYCF